MAQIIREAAVAAFLGAVEAASGRMIMGRACRIGPGAVTPAEQL